MGHDGTFSHLTECRDLHVVNSTEVCKFINVTEDCHLSCGFLDYTYFTYCVFNSKLLPLTITILFLWLAFLFTAVAVAADDFFCPALAVISKMLKMSDNLAGVTLLAFGNGSADVFSAIAAIRSSRNGDVSLAFCALMGAGVFVTTIIAGSVCIIQPFQIMQRPFLRDLIFYIGSVFLTFCILYYGKITTPTAIAYILLYVFYVMVIIVARFVHKKTKFSGTSVQQEGFQGLVGSVVSSVDDLGVDDSLDQPIYVSHQDCLGNQNTECNQVAADEHVDNNQSDCAPLLSNDEVETVILPSPVIEFLHAISPVDTLAWKQAGYLSKCISIVKGTAKFILGITVPVVDYSVSKHHWNQLLNSIHCVITPVVALFLSKPDLCLYQIQGVFPVWATMLIGGFTVSLVVFFTSTSSHPPCYHWLFAWAGFLMAVVWIQWFATEIVNLLQTIGIIFDLTNGILGLTLLAWGNSISDLISDVTMARHGYPRTAISACYGGPMFNLLLGIGIPFTFVCLQNGGSVLISLNEIEVLLISYLLMILVVTMVTVPFVLKFHMAKSFGSILLGFYAVFIILVILLQSNVVTFNT